uniref:Uncharacterized protein n=1 Tax=Arundo donax TaxID=35708 RepID=A0A0A9EF85_ARUDO
MPTIIMPRNLLAQGVPAYCHSSRLMFFPCSCGVLFIYMC